jgi:hypothetical protein
MITARGRRAARSWGPDIRMDTPLVTHLPRALREELADAWLEDALLEHASIASFARLSLELLAVGAPADLCEATHRAALDEIRHAGLCFALAAAYRGEPVAPTALPITGDLRLASSLTALAVSTFQEGCVGETIAALVAEEQLARATDPAVRAALAVIAEDEARHAELAWRIVAWAVRAGGSGVQSAIASAIEGMTMCAPLPAANPRAPVGEMEQHGRIGREILAMVQSRALDEVVLPSARAMALPTERLHAQLSGCSSSGRALRSNQEVAHEPIEHGPYREGDPAARAEAARLARAHRCR